MKYFEVFGIHPKFLFEEEDYDLLEKQFLNLQKENYYGDGVVSLQTNFLNEAYVILKDDVKRAEYLLKNLGIALEELVMESELIEDIIEIREDILDSETESEVQQKLSDVEIEIGEDRKALEFAFTEILPLIAEKKPLSNNEKKVLSNAFLKFKCLDEILKKYKRKAI